MIVNDSGVATGTTLWLAGRPGWPQTSLTSRGALLVRAILTAAVALVS